MQPTFLCAPYTLELCTVKSYAAFCRACLQTSKAFHTVEFKTNQYQIKQQIGEISLKLYEPYLLSRPTRAMVRSFAPGRGCASPTVAGRAMSFTRPTRLPAFSWSIFLLEAEGAGALPRTWLVEDSSSNRYRETGRIAFTSGSDHCCPLVEASLPSAPMVARGPVAS